MNPTDDTNQKNDFKFSFDVDDSGLPESIVPKDIPMPDVAPATAVPAMPVSIQADTMNLNMDGAFPQPPVEEKIVPPADAPVKMATKKSNMLPVAGGVLALLLVIGGAVFASNTSYFLAVFRGDIRPFAYENPCEVNDCEARGPNTVQITVGGKSTVVPKDEQGDAHAELTADKAVKDADAEIEKETKQNKNPTAAQIEKARKAREQAAVVKANRSVKKAEKDLAAAQKSGSQVDIDLATLRLKVQQDNLNAVRNTTPAAGVTPVVGTGGGTVTQTVATAVSSNVGQVTGSGDISSCIGLGGGEAERQCYVEKSGQLSTEYCLGLSADACAEKARTEGLTVQTCAGEQDTSGDQTGEFTACGADATNGCGQVDILGADGSLKGFVIDKSACGGGGGGGGTTTTRAGQACSYIKLYVQDTVNTKKWDPIAPVATGSAIVVDDGDKLVNYSKGWTAQAKQKGFAGNTEHISKKLNATAQYNFSGTSITFAYGTDKNYGVASILIDDKQVETIDMYSAAAGHSTKVYNNLSTGFHSFKVVATNTKGTPASKNTYISLDSVTVNPNTGIAVNVGQKLRLAVKGNRGRWSEARFTINGATPVTSKTVVNGEYVYDYTVPATGPYTIQAEVLPR